MNHEEKKLAERYTVEGFEDTWAVLEVEASRTFNVPRTWLPSEAAEGDVLVLSLETGAGESIVRFVLDTAETEERRKRVRELRDSLPKAPEGDLEL